MGQHPGGDESEGDDAHGLLRVVGAVGERNQRGRTDLPPAKSTLRPIAGRTPGDEVREVGRQHRHDAGDDRRENGRKHDLFHDHPELHRGPAGADPHSADQPPEQRVRRTGRQPGEPGHQVPQDRADETGEDHHQGHLGVVHDAARDGPGHGRGQERADQIQHPRDGDGEARSQGTGGHRRRHRIGCVVEPVGEVEGESRQNDDDEKERDGTHGETSRGRPDSAPAVRARPDASDFHAKRRFRSLRPRGGSRGTARA